MAKALESQFDIWSDNVPESQEIVIAKERASVFLDKLSLDESETLLEYIDQVQRQAFYGGYCMGVQLAAECFCEGSGYEEFQ